MSDALTKRNKRTRKFDPVKKFGVRKKRWEVENEEIVSLEARLKDLESVRSHAVPSDIRALRDITTVSYTYSILIYAWVPGYNCTTTDGARGTGRNDNFAVGVM